MKGLFKKLTEPLIVVGDGTFTPDQISTEPSYGFQVGIKKGFDDEIIVGIHDPRQHAHLAIAEVRSRYPEFDVSNIVFATGPQHPFDIVGWTRT